MSSQDHEKPGGKSGRKKQKRNKKPDQRADPDAGSAGSQRPDRRRHCVKREFCNGRRPHQWTRPRSIHSRCSKRLRSKPSRQRRRLPLLPKPHRWKRAPVSAVASAEPSPVGIQTIASAYRDYTRKSLEDARSYVEKLSGARSIDKAVEVQAEFAKQAYETFVADSLEDPRALRRTLQAEPEASEVAARRSVEVGEAV